MSNKYKNKEYLGDGVYAEFDGYQVWLSTLQGMSIALEPTVINNLFKYFERHNHDQSGENQ